MGIVDEDVARVRAAADFVALASEHMALRRVGTRWVGLCPFHPEKTPSFSLNAQENLYYCFGCGARGDVITFAREILHLDFPEAVGLLASRAGITLRYDDGERASEDRRRRARITETLEAAVAWYHERLVSAPDAAAARRYLRTERGYDGEVVRAYRLGWAPDGWDQLLRALKLPPAALADAGLAQRDGRGRYRDFFRSRVLFPIFDPSGKPIGAGGRTLPGGPPPKYKNTAHTAVYDKSKVLYGLDRAKTAVAASDRVVVCEGYTDVIGLQRAGVAEAVATCGTALAEGHLQTLQRFARRIVLAYDADTAGQAAAERFFAWERRYELDIRVAALPPGEDPADLARRDPASLVAAVEGARPLLEFQLNGHLGRADLSTAEGRVRAATAAVALVAAHPDELVRDQYLMVVADRCRIPPERLRSLPVPAGGPRPGRRGGGAEREVANRPDGPPRPPAVPVAGPELAALRLAVQRPAEVAARLDRCLFAHPVARDAFDVLASAATLHEAIEAGDAEVAALVGRLAVEEADEAADDVMVRLVERAGALAQRELRADLAAAGPAEQADYARVLGWLKQAIEALRPPDGTPREARVRAEEQLVAWLVDREGGVADEAVGAAPDVVDEDAAPVLGGAG